MNQAIFVLFVLLTVANGVHYKHLAGPPEEFSNHLIPDPRSVLTVEESNTNQIWFETLADNIVFDEDIPVDGPNQFTFLFASPYEDSLQLKLTDPNGKNVELEKFSTKSPFPIGEDSSVMVNTYSLSNSVQGVYHLTISTSLTAQDIEIISKDPQPNAILTVMNNDYVQMQTHMSSYIIRQGSSFGLVSRVVDTSPQQRNLDIHISSASMNVFTPSGQDIDVQMRDDGNNGDEQANDGWYTAILPTLLGGTYRAEADIVGYFDGPGATDGPVAFKRSTQHVVAVSSGTASITGRAVLRDLDSERYAIDISVTSDSKQPPLRAYAQVWGHHMNTSEIIPACWIGGAVDVITSNNNNFITIELNKNWLVRAGVSGSLVLRGVYLSDLSTSFPIDVYPGEITVENSRNLIRALPLQKEIPITKEMLYGVNPLLNRTKSKSGGAGNIVLLPGYCSTNNPFLRTKQEFPAGVFFIGQGNNINNDQYTKLVLTWIDSLSLSSFGIIGHSQGGMVALHMHNFYFTGLEEATGERLIQSVGTPWQGTTAAGSAAGLGAIFGFGCGSSTDLSRDGATNWASGISAAARADVYSYSTTYKTGNFFGDYCSLAMNLILQYPNDGVTELKYATLPGANNLGNTEKWCHSMNMAYPPQADDIPRNKIMNSLAAH